MWWYIYIYIYIYYMRVYFDPTEFICVYIYIRTELDRISMSIQYIYIYIYNIYIYVEIGCPIEVSWPIFKTPLWTCVSNSFLSIKYHIQLWEGNDGQSVGLTYVGNIIHIRFPLPSSWLKLMLRIQKLCFPGVSDTPVCQCSSYTWHGQNYVPQIPYHTF